MLYQNGILRLHSNPEFQEGFLEIDLLLRIGVTELHFDNRDLEKGFEFFEKPQHWFLPFYSDNPILIEANLDRETEYLLHESPLFSHIEKYVYCLTYNNWDEEMKKEFRDILIKTTETYPQSTKNSDALLTARISIEYQLYIFELHNFSRSYPSEQYKHIFNKRLQLYETKLEDLVLGETHKIKLKTTVLLQNGEYEKAIILLNQMFRLNPNNSDVLNRIGYCYQQQAEFNTALKYHLKADKIIPDQAWSLKNIGK